MTLPTGRDVHVDAALTNLSVAYIQSAEGFIANQVFPFVPVEHQSDKYFIWDKADMNRDSSRKAAAGTPAPRVGARLSTDSYFAEEYDLAYELYDKIRRNADPAVDLEAVATSVVTQGLLIGAEVRWATSFFTTGKWAVDKVGGTDFVVWSNFAGSDPAQQASDARIAIKKATGQTMNTMIVSEAVHEVLKRHPLIKEQFKYTTSESLTKAILARYFEVDRYLVAGAVKATSGEGATTATMDYIVGNNVLFAHVATSPGLMIPSAGYTFVWAGYTGLNNLGVAVRNFRIENIKADVIEGNFAYDQKLTGSDLGYFLSGVI